MTNHRCAKSSLKTGASFVALSFALAVSSAASSASLPDHGHYVSGQGSINKANRSLTVKQSTTTGIIDWKGFSVGAKNSVTFDNGGGATLNRVTGGNLSKIAGSLHATGSLYLINSQGVIVSGTGRVVTGGNFVASTGSITNNAFDDGNRKFRHRSGDIVNRGSIVAGGNLRVSAHNVSDSGSEAGSNVTLHAANDLDIGGSVAARRAAGGIVFATGRHIAIAGTADISANGRRGGTVLIGGDIHGGAVESEDFVHRHVRDAETTKIAKGATISANASHGAGGDIVIWSDGHTTFKGSVSAEGRTDGGFAEISSKKLLGFKGGVDLLAKHGQTGTLLLDPEDVVITDGTTANGSIASGTFTPNGDDSVLNVTDLQNALANANVDVVTGSSGSQTGDITVLDPVTWSSPGTLTLDAYHSIYIDAAIAITGTGGLVLTTNDGGSGGDYYFNGGNVVFSDVVSGNTQGSLIINGTTYELVNSVSQLASDVSVNAYNFYALANSYDAGVDGTYSSSPVGILFHGTFEGLGNTISNLTVDDTTDADVGLFAEIDASGALRDIGLVGGSISGSAISAQIGDLVGYNDGGTITRDYATGAVTGGANAIVGGLVGANSGSISQSYTTGAVSGGGDSGIGGLVGSSNGAISQSYATGAVTDTAIGIDAGGLVGANSGSISQSYATGAVTGGNISPVGGLVGVSNGTITQSYATGTVTAGEHAYVGGLVGQNGGTLTASYATGAVTGGTSAYVGGFVGQNDANATIDESYSTGTATGLGGASVGGFAGENSGTLGHTTAVYYNSDDNSDGVGTGTAIANGDGLSLAAMMTATNFSGWTFGTTGGGSGWVIVDVESSLNNDGGTTGATTPMLLSEYSTNITSAHQLQLMALDVTANYTLNNDIDAGSTGSGTDVWGSSTGFVPIGNLGIEFTGTFNGHGHTISGLTIDDSVSDSVGLFAVADNATIENVGLVGGSITASHGADTGALAGDVLDASTFSNVYSTANVTGDEDVGGLIGNLQDTATIAGSYATGTVTLTSGGADGGGLVGTAGITSAISNSYATGAVSGGDNVNLGGLVGDVGSRVSISDSYATGAVTGGAGANVGGLVGQDVGATYTDTYWDTDTSGIGSTQAIGNGANPSGITGLTTAALSSALPGGFGSSVWGNVSNQTTPYLLALTSNPQTVYIGADSTTAPFSLLFNIDQVQAINSDLSANYALANDIDASATASWNSGAGFKPLGNYSTGFSGVFDGLGNTVSNLMIDDSTDTNVGLFGYVTGTISNVSVSGSVSGSAADADVGGIVGFLFYGTVSNAHSAIAVSDTGGTSGQGAGGLVGFNSFGTITQSSATGNVSMNGDDVAAGGLVGVNGGPITQSFATGNVTLTDSIDVSGNAAGGLVGVNDDDAISQSYAMGNVTMTGGALAFGGGLVGTTENGGTIADSYSIGTVAASTEGGWLATMTN
jgi:filamentous hemagglutinin family protein